MEKPQYNLNVCPFWKTPYGHYKGLIVNQEVFDSIQKVELGGMLLFKILPEERRKNPEKSPHAVMEYIPADKIQGFKTKIIEPRVSSPEDL